jgi:non-specific serine/threonine protein kinase
MSALAISPTGRLHWSAAGAAALPAAAQARITAAFARSPPHGILHLGLAEVATPLPAELAYFRELARELLVRVCATPDLETLRERIRVEAPHDLLVRHTAAAPPMEGAEYLDLALLERLWDELNSALHERLHEFSGSAQTFLQAQSPVWNLVGRVCFHLAENKRDQSHPFAFVATFSSKLSASAKVQHLPLGQAVRDSGRARDKAALLALLAPVEKAANASPFLRELVDSGDVFQALAWTPREAYRFLKDVPAFEAAGVVVRVPDWWRAPPRPQVTVRIGDAAPAKLGADALLDFNATLTLEGEPLSAAEWRALRQNSDGLALVRGRWVVLDNERLQSVLDHWKTAQQHARAGLSFFEGMRLIAGAQLDTDDNAGPASEAIWSRVDAGAWLSRTLAELRNQDGDVAPELLRATLRPYQQRGTNWLRFLSSLGLGACLADDMGLGKTIQVLALLILHKQSGPQRTHLLVAPASLLANWQAEIARFAPTLAVMVAHPSALPSKELAFAPRALAAFDIVITSYGSVARLPWLGEATWDTVILDEAQAIKNAGAKQTRACKALRSRVRVALTGTPVENRLGDLWSIFDFLNPGLLGSAKTFAAFGKKLAASGDYSPLRTLVRPYLLRRLKTDKQIIADLPDKTEVRAYASLTKVQAALYADAVDALRAQLTTLADDSAGDGMKRRGSVLAALLRFKQICNHPSHFLGDGGFAPEASGKFQRLREIAEAIAAKQEKALVFTQFREMTEPLAAFLTSIFGRSGVVLHGGTPVAQRQALVNRFQDDDEVPFFVLTTKAGGTGLTLTAAAHVIHFDRWWNPAVENQATDRAYRIGQKKNVLVHKLVCRGTVEDKIDELLEAKKSLSQQLLEGGGELLLTELGDDELVRLVSLDINRALAEG